MITSKTGHRQKLKNREWIQEYNTVHMHMILFLIFTVEKNAFFFVIFSHICKKRANFRSIKQIVKKWSKSMLE